MSVKIFQLEVFDFRVLLSRIGVADPENSPSPIDGAVIVVTEQLTEV